MEALINRLVTRRNCEYYESAVDVFSGIKLATLARDEAIIKWQNNYAAPTRTTTTTTYTWRVFRERVNFER